MNIDPKPPDLRFKVAVAAAGDITIIMPADLLLQIELVDGTRVLLIGDPNQETRSLMDTHTTKELVRKLSIQPRALHRLRLHLGMPTGATGQRGGARPKAGRKKSEGQP